MRVLCCTVLNFPNYDFLLKFNFISDINKANVEYVGGGGEVRLNSAYLGHWPKIGKSTENLSFPRSCLLLVNTILD